MRSFSSLFNYFAGDQAKPQEIALQNEPLVSEQDDLSRLQQSVALLNLRIKEAFNAKMPSSRLPLLDAGNMEMLNFIGLLKQIDKQIQQLFPNDTNKNSLQLRASLERFHHHYKHNVVGPMLEVLDDFNASFDLMLKLLVTTQLAPVL